MYIKGKMYRDIKGVNILLIDYGDVKLVDFGVVVKIIVIIVK